MNRHDSTEDDYGSLYYYQCADGNRIFIREGQTEDEVLAILNSIVSSGTEGLNSCSNNNNKNKLVS